MKNTNYIQIIKYFDTIIKIEQNRHNIFVTGLKNNQTTTETYSYKFCATAKAVYKLIKNYKG